MNLVTWIIRTLRIPGTWVTCTSCVGLALDQASVRVGDRKQAGSLDLLLAVLDAEGCGLVRLLAVLGQDVPGLRLDAESSVQQATSTDRDCMAVFRESFEVVPVVPIRFETSGGPITRKQELHSCHLLWGFTRRGRCDAAALLRRRGISNDTVTRLVHSWTEYDDAV